MSDQEQEEVWNPHEAENGMELHVEEPNSVYNKVPHSIQYFLKTAPANLFESDLKELVKLTANGHWSDLDFKLRASFWSEYEASCSNSRMIKLTNVYRGICSQTMWMKISSDKVRMAYILRPFTEDKITYKELGELGNDKLKELLTMDYRNDEGGIDAKLAAIVLKATEMALNRSKGAVLQVIHNKNLNMNVNTDAKDIKNLPMSLEDIDAELMKLEEKRNKVIKEVPSEVVIGNIVITNDQKNTETD